MTEREDELAWHERVLDEKEQELNKIEESLAKGRSLKAVVETIQKGLEYLQTQVKQMSENIAAERSKLQRARQAACHGSYRACQQCFNC